ncbi:MAG: GDYXXLXY domain-containing protein, partial [Dolichospermum sp.]
ESKKTLTPEMEFSEKLTFRDYLIATEQKANKPLPIWRLIAPLLFQVGLILAVPVQAMYTDMAGKTIILETVSTNSDNLFIDSSFNLDYDISRPEILRKVSGWREWLRKNSRRNGQIIQGSTLYLILQEQQSFNRSQFQSWKPVRVSINRPLSLVNNQVALRGNYQNGLINYGLENYFISDAQRQQINNVLARIQEGRDSRPEPILVRIKVDPQGNAIPTGLSIRNRNYPFQ